jgi:thiol-disulfide isomerase/thioredoxin
MIAALVCGSLAAAAQAGVLLSPTSAEEWEVSEWINADPGPLANYRGKVVFINFFQLWCPGSNSFSIPLFQKWEEEYDDRDDVVFISIHSVFESHKLQTPEQLRQFVEARGIKHPVGVDKYAKPGDEVPVTMNRYETGGSPHVVIVDQEGRVRFSHFGRFEVEPVEAFIQRLFNEPGTSKRKTLRKGNDKEGGQR